MSKEEKKNKIPKIFWYSIVFSIIFLLNNAFRLFLLDLLTPLLEPILEIMVLLFFLFFFVKSLIYGFSKAKIYRVKAFVPFIINFMTIVLVFIVPFNAIVVNLSFHLNFNKYQEVVKKIIDGELVPNVSHNSKLIALPDKYKSLSKGGGEVIVKYGDTDVDVFFFIFRGILDNFSGLVYEFNDNEPEIGDFGCDYIEIKKLKDHWYWMACR